MWHYVQNGQACGPVEASAVQMMLQSGSLGPDALLWKQGMADWAPARSVAEFAPFCRPATMPPPLPPVPPLGLPPKVPTTSMDPEKFDIEHNKVFAVLAYLGILFLVPLLAAPSSKFARYHTNQGIVLFLASFLLWCGSFVLLPIPIIHFVIIPVWFVLPACVFIFIVIGIVHAASGEYKPLPWIGHYRLLN
jgi:uncharacterized membrane protein